MDRRAGLLKKAGLRSYPVFLHNENFGQTNFYGEYFENPEHHDCGYDCDYGVTKADQSEQAVFLFGRWRRWAVKRLTDM